MQAQRRGGVGGGQRLLAASGPTSSDEREAPLARRLAQTQDNGPAMARCDGGSSAGSAEFTGMSSVASRSSRSFSPLMKWTMRSSARRALAVRDRTPGWLISSSRQ